MKTIGLLFILITVTACIPSYVNRPIQDQAVGGTSVLDAITGRDRVGLVAKQAHYDSFISKAMPSDKWFSKIPILNIFARPDGYEICAAPPADAMAASASSLAAAISGEGSTEEKAVTIQLAGTLADSFANSVIAFSFRTQGLQYIRDVRFNNCMTWLNRGHLEHPHEESLRAKLMAANAMVDSIGKELILYELKLRAETNNFGVSSVAMLKEEINEVQQGIDNKLEKIAGIVDKLNSPKVAPVTPPVTK